MNKFSFIAIVIAIVIGLGAGYMLFDKADQGVIDRLEAEKAYYKNLYDSALIEKNKAEEALINLEMIARQDSIDVQKALTELSRVKRDSAKMNQALNEFKKLTSHEKAQALINRYK